MERSYVGISLSFEGDPFKFWGILKAMKATSEKEGVKFECGNVTTIKEG